MTADLAAASLIDEGQLARSEHWSGRLNFQHATLTLPEAGSSAKGDWSCDMYAKGYLSSLLFAVPLAIAMSAPASGLSHAIPAQLASDEFVDQADLVAVLSSGDIDEIIRTMNLIKRQGSKGEILPFIQDLWARQSDKHPDLPWDMVERDVVRIELGNILIQADNNGFFEADRQAINDYAFVMADSDDTQVAIEAILTLGLIEDPRNARKIAEIAKNGRSRLFRAAVIGLSTMCLSEASEALDEISNNTTDNDVKQYIARVRESHASFREYKCQ